MQASRPQGGGILPIDCLKSLDDFIDRLNRNQTASEADSIYVLLVGTNEGIPLSRSYGAMSNTHQGGVAMHISDELLSSVETIWATLPSAMHPSQRLSTSSLSSLAAVNMNTSATKDPRGIMTPPFNSPHPLLKHLGLGEEVKVTTAFYDSCNLVHVHFSPLVVTILTSHDANLGKIEQSIPTLSQILEPIRKTLIEMMSS